LIQWFFYPACVLNSYALFAFRLGSKGEDSLKQRLAIAIYKDGGANDYECNSNLNLNTWQHIAATYDGTNVRFYINGQFDGQQTASLTMDSGTHTFRVGDSPEHNRPYQGSIDELYVYNRALNNAEIYQLYASNLQKINQTHWNYNVTQAKNTEDELDIGTYTYQLFAEDQNNQLNNTEKRTIYIVGITPPVPESSTLLMMSVGLISFLSLIFVKKKMGRDENEK